MADLKAGSMKAHRFARYSPELPGWTLIALLCVTFLMGGGARADIQSLIVLRPIAALALVYALYKAAGADLAGFRLPILVMACWLGVVGLQLVPLPPELWTSLPGREPIVTAILAVGETPGWHPLSVVPVATWNAFFALFLPLAVLLLYASANPEARQRALYAICIFALASAVFGMLQAISGLGVLYPYEISNRGMPIGFFSNRNHQAALIAALIPMLLALAANRASQRNASQAIVWVMRGLCLALTIIVVMTGSRTGTVLAIAMLAIGSLFIKPGEGPGSARHRPRAPASRAAALARQVAVPAVLLVTIAVVFLIVQGTAFERFASKDGLGDLRFEVLPTIISAIRDGLPLGFGVGTFPQVYEIHELSQLIRPAYLNHAHNDWVEIFLEGGLVLPLVALVGMVWLIGRCWHQRARFFAPVSPGDRLRFAAALGIVVFLAASITDYPLRSPAAAAVFMVLVGRLATSRKAP